MTAEVLRESLPPMPEAAADRVRDVVLPAADRGSPLLRLCRCQYGACGSCLVGRHDNCTDARIVGPDTYLIGKRVAVLVWRSGAPCSSRCLCECRTPTPAPVVELGPLGQLGLFDLAGGGS